jgi:putative ABC transport system permease protein
VTPPNARGFPARLREASPGYFRALGIPLRAGRLFTDRDVGIVVNEALVREHFPHEDPIGRVLDRGTNYRGGERRPPEYSIAGRTRDFQCAGADVVLCCHLVVSTRLPPTTLIASVRAAVHQISPNQAIYDVRTMEEVVTSSHADLNLSFTAHRAVCGVALLLALAGIYGVIPTPSPLDGRNLVFAWRLAQIPDGCCDWHPDKEPYWSAREC